jgi:hypothetical protein
MLCERAAKEVCKNVRQKKSAFPRIFCDADGVSSEGFLVLQLQDQNFPSIRFLLYEPFMVECASPPLQLFQAL